uniref:C->U-editing enzyme APOBEC-1 n=1 Tax=Podarcis muralis TaxID=64176 RepID=A0A670KDD5_PODMU
MVVNYTPIGRPERTHLLYEIQWGRSRRYWRNWCTSNRTHHAEINFLENACEEIDRRTTTPCTVTWFLTWSPCGKCSGRIKQFLQEHPNVTLEIRAAKLFNHNYKFNQKGLRDLANFGVRIYIMHSFKWRRVELQLNEELPSYKIVEDEVEGGREQPAETSLESLGVPHSPRRIKKNAKECDSWEFP